MKSGGSAALEEGVGSKRSSLPLLKNLLNSHYLTASRDLEAAFLGELENKYLSCSVLLGCTPECQGTFSMLLSYAEDKSWSCSCSPCIGPQGRPSSVSHANVKCLLCDTSLKGDDSIVMFTQFVACRMVMLACLYRDCCWGLSLWIWCNKAKGEWRESICAEKCNRCRKPGFQIRLISPCRYG